MAVSQQTQCSKFADGSAPSLLKPFLPSHLGPFSGNQTVAKAAQYIGSFMVTGKGHHDRAEIVRQRLESARSYTHSKPIVLLISLNGIKVCRDSDKHVYMAHALRRISYATCDPDNLQFAFLAREPKAEPNVQYCHAFVTNTPEEAEDLNNIVGEAFRVAYAQQQLALLAQRLRGTASQPPTNHSPLATTQPASSDRVCPPAKAQPFLTNGNAPDSMNLPVHSSPSRLSSNPCESPASAVASVFSSKALPPSQQPAAETVDPSPPDVDNANREHRVHKHHKHHKHRHRHKAKDVAAQTTLPACDNRSLDSGLQTSESASGGDPSNQLPPRQSRLHLLPPAPPPRGSSSLDCAEPKAALAAASISPIDCAKLRSTGQSPAPTGSPVKPTNDVVDAVALHSIREELGDGNIARPSPVASRPPSQHSYDIADHRGCGALSPTCPADNAVASSLPVVNSDRTTSVSVPAATATTASSSTTGCSTATSGSARSGSGSAGSFPGFTRSDSGPPDCRLTVRGSSSLEMMHRRHSGHTPTQPASTPSNCGDSRRRNSRASDLPSYDTLYEAEELAHVAWYQPNVPRETALEILSRQPAGSFIVRDSGTHSNCYALSVRFGEGPGRCLPPGIQSPTHFHSSSFSGEPTPEPRAGGYAYPSHNTTGISHFLIQRTPSGGVRLKGLDKEWPSLSCLVLHLTVMPEMLPCPLRLPKSAANPTFSPTDARADTQPVLELVSSAPSGFRPIQNAPLDESGNPVSAFEDEDYQRLSDFSAIMADLKQQPRLSKRPVRAGR